MIDLFALLMVHGLLFVALYRLMNDDTLDEDPVLQQREEGLPDEAGAGAAGPDA